MSFGASLKRFRLKQGLTQQQLAEALGLTENVISKYENNLVNPPLDKAIQIANYFHSCSGLMCQSTHCKPSEELPMEFSSLLQQISQLKPNEQKIIIITLKTILKELSNHPATCNQTN